MIVLTFTGPPHRDVYVGSRDTYNFRRGMPVKMTDAGQIVPMTRRERARAWFKRVWHRWTRWWRPRMVVSRINPDNGIITLERERWSWRRWRWERDEFTGNACETNAALLSGVPPDDPPSRGS